MGGTDDSVRKYTYDDVPDDATLENFKLADEDVLYKVGFLRRVHLCTSPDTVLRTQSTKPLRRSRCC